MQEGSAGNAFYIVADGEVKVTKESEDGEVSKRLACGDYFGELALLHCDRRQATVTATKKARVLVLDRRTFKRLLGPLETMLKQNAELYDTYVDHN